MASNQSGVFSTLAEDVRLFWGCWSCRKKRISIKKSRCPTCNSCKPTSFGYRAAAHAMSDDDNPASDSSSRFYLCRIRSAQMRFRVSVLQLRDNKLMLLSIDTESEQFTGDLVHGAITALETQLTSENAPPIRRLNRRGFSVLPPLSPRSGQVTPVAPSPSASLFDQVLQNGRQITYIPSIGRYVPVASLSSEVSAKSARSPVPDYVNRMEVQQKEMKKVVETALYLRRSRRLMEGTLFESVPSKAEAKNTCPLCEHAFPVSQLLGKVSHRSILLWKQRHGVALPSDSRAKASRLHDAVAICLFCMQFFDPDFGDYIDDVKIAQDAGVARWVARPIRRSNAYYKQVTRKALRAMDDIAVRPTSRLAHKLSMSELKAKSAAERGPSSQRFVRIVKGPGQRLDQSKAGFALRTKYANVEGQLLVEKKKKTQRRCRSLPPPNAMRRMVQESRHAKATFLTDAAPRDSVATKKATRAATSRHRGESVEAPRVSLPVLHGNKSRQKATKRREKPSLAMPSVRKTNKTKPRQMAEVAPPTKDPKQTIISGGGDEKSSSSSSSAKQPTAVHVRADEAQVLSSSSSSIAAAAAVPPEAVPPTVPTSAIASTAPISTSAAATARDTVRKPLMFKVKSQAEGKSHDAPSALYVSGSLQALLLKDHRPTETATESCYTKKIKIWRSSQQEQSVQHQKLQQIPLPQKQQQQCTQPQLPQKEEQEQHLPLPQMQQQIPWQQQQQHELSTLRQEPQHMTTSPKQQVQEKAQSKEKDGNDQVHRSSTIHDPQQLPPTNVPIRAGTAKSMAAQEAVSAQEDNTTADFLADSDRSVAAEAHPETDIPSGRRSPINKPFVLSPLPIQRCPQQLARQVSQRLRDDEDHDIREAIHFLEQEELEDYANDIFELDTSRSPDRDEEVAAMDVDTTRGGTASRQASRAASSRRKHLRSRQSSLERMQLLSAGSASRPESVSRSRKSRREKRGGKSLILSSESQEEAEWQWKVMTCL